MRRYIAYLKYLITHKYYASKLCFKYNLYWRGVKHDWSKFLPSEFFPSARYFFNSDGTRIPKHWTYYDVREQEDIAFEKARLKHQHRHDHHWQHWIFNIDCGDRKAVKMDRAAALEMFLDWYSTGMAQGTSEIKNWYVNYGPYIELHDSTRDYIEELIRKHVND